jgi:hypothetical protein
VQGRRAARAACLAIGFAVAAASPARAAVIQVTTTTDGEAFCASPTSCVTIRAALVEAARQLGDDTILVPAGETQLNSALGVTTNVTIAGAGAGQTTIRASGTDRVFSVAVQLTVTFTGLTMRGGVDPGSSGGGALFVGNRSTTALDHVRVTGGTASIGGGIMNDAATQLTIDKSLIDGNAARGDGGGIYSIGNSANASSLIVRDTTIAGNSAVRGGGVGLFTNAPVTTRLERVTVASNPGGGVFIGDPGPVQIGSSILAGNPGSNCGGVVFPGDLGANVESGRDCDFGLASDRQNADPGLNGLADAGGQTPVMALAADSPAVDLAGACGPAADQRDLERPQGAACDAGAYELARPPAPPPPPPAPAPTPPVATPEPQRSVAGQVVDGTVRVRKPGSRTFIEIDPTRPIPLGSTIDAKQGEIRITALQAKGGQPHTATFFDGIFKITQTRRTTDLTLTEALASCGGKARAAAKKPKSRRLWGDGSGSFRTRGQYSSATVRGTRWLVQDSCAGTLTRVKRGVVSVHDNLKRRTILLRAGHSYLARPRRP